MRTQHTNHGAFLGATQQAIFQLPPPPPGMQWHRTDGWQEGDLPQGMRPLVLEEHSTNATQQRYSGGWMRLSDSVIADPLEEPMRTTTSLTFTHAGKQWTWHRSGDPMPCDGGRNVILLQADDMGNRIEFSELGYRSKTLGRAWDWSDDTIVGWRYADEKKTVPLGPEDVPPCCAFRRQNESSDYIMPTSVYVGGIYGHDEIVFRHTWEYLKEHYQINRSLPLTGKWNPDAWEPCSKEVLA